MNKLGFSNVLAERQNELLSSLNESMKELIKTNHIMQKFENINFLISGNYSDNNLKLLVNFKTPKESGVKEFISYVDESSIYIHSDFIKAYFGEEKYEEVHELIMKNNYEFDCDYLKTFEPILFNQLATHYLLNSSPNTLEGAEFTDSDLTFFIEILENNKGESVYDEKIELNEYIEKFSEIKPLLDQICEQIKVEKVLVINDGCKEPLQNKVIKYLEDHDIKVELNNLKK